MPRILSRIFSFGLFSFWVCSSTGQGRDRAGWHKVVLLALPLTLRGCRLEARDNHLSSALVWHTGLQSQGGSRGPGAQLGEEGLGLPAYV